MKNFLGKKTKLNENIVIGLYITANAVNYVQIEKQKDQKPILKAFDQIIITEADQYQQLQALSQKLNAPECITHLILPSKNYQLMMIDTPTAAPQEMKGALQWKLKDLVDFPIEDATLGYFDIPAKRANDEQQLGFAIVSKTANILALQTMIIQAGFQLQSIDIIELAIRNLVVLANKGVQPTAVVRLTNRGGSVLYVRGGLIYMNRQFELPLEALLTADSADEEEIKHLQESLALEIQRSIDYCASYLRQPMVSELLVTPLVKAQPKFLEYLHQTTGVQVNTLDLSEIFTSQEPISSQIQNRTLLAFGATIRPLEEKKK